MRAFSNSLLAILLVAALFWGNCFSCPQVLSSLKSDPAHGCCHKTKQAPKDCRTQVFKQFEKADPVPPSMPALVAALVTAPEPQVSLSFEPAPVPLEHTPPSGVFSLRI
jgi:hypothetical protein